MFIYAFEKFQHKTSKRHLQTKDWEILGRVLEPMRADTPFGQQWSDTNGY